MADDSVTNRAGEQQPEISAVGSIARYASSNIFRHLMRVVNAFLKPMLLAPELLGLWNLLNIIPNYLPYIYLGSSTSMRYQIPANQARGDAEANRLLAGAVFTGTLVLSGVVAVGLALSGIFFPGSRATQAGLGTMAVISILAWYHEYQVSLLKASQQFRLLSSVNFLYATILSILSLVLILFFRIYGLYVALLISSLSIILYISSRYRLPQRAPYQHAIFCSTVRSGLPIMLFSLGAMLIQTSDKLIISSTLGLEALGHYGIATMVFGFLMHVPGATREVLEPKLMYEFQQRPLDEILNDYLTKPLLTTAYLMPLLIGPAVLLLPELVKALLPVYAAGVPAAQILVVGGFYLALSYILRGLIVAKGVQLSAAKVMFGVALVNLALSLLLLQLGLGIAGVALASAVSFFLLFAGQLALVRRCLPAQSGIIRIRTCALSFVCCVGLLGPLQLLRSYLPLPSLLTAVTALVIYGLLFLWIYNRAADHYGCFSRLQLRWPWRR